MPGPGLRDRWFSAIIIGKTRIWYGASLLDIRSRLADCKMATHPTSI